MNDLPNAPGGIPGGQIVLINPNGPGFPAQAAGQLMQMGYAMPQVAQASGPSELEMPMVDVGEIFRALAKRWKLITLCFAAFTGLGVAYIKNTKPVFESKAQLEVQQEKVQVITGNFGTNDFKSLEILKTIELKLTTQSMMQRIIDLNGLASDPSFYVGKTNPPQEDELIWYLKSKVFVELDRGTRLINISVKDTDAARAAQLARSLAEEAKKLSRDENVATAKQAKADLESELERSRKAMADADKAAEQFRREHVGIYLPDKQSEMKTTEVEDVQKQLTQQLSENERKLIHMAAICDKIRQVGGQGAEYLVQVPEIAALPEVVQLQTALNLEEANFAKVDAVYLHKYPKHIEAKQKLEEMRTRLRIAVDNAANGFMNSLSAAKQETEALKTAMKNAKSGALLSQEVYDSWEPLRRQVQAKHDYYDQVLRRYQEAEVAANMNSGLINISDYPVKASRPKWPDKRLILLGSGLLGGAIGVGLALLLRLLDSSVRSLGEGERALRLPGLAAIPVEKESNPMQRLVSSPNAASEVTEAFRALRTSLSLLGKGLHARTFLFTSATAGEGKSYCAVNHAVTLAQQGYRTLIIDADLRKPSLDELLIGRRNVAGLVSHLRGESEVEGAKPCNPTRIPNLFLFSAGVTEKEHPAELLSSQAFQQLLQEAGKWFHRIVIDTPPVNSVTDALLMAREVDSVALVMKAGVTKKAEAQQALKKLAMAGAKPVGFVLNAAPAEALVQGYMGAFSPLPTNAPLALGNG
jgi:polysaccharide biosynthesis transport protein